MRHLPRRAALPWLLALLGGLLPPLAAPGRAAPIAAEYEARAAGLTIMRAQVVYDLAAPGGGYRVVARSRLTGLAGIFGGSENETRVEGSWQGAEARPTAYRSTGRFRGSPRLTELAWRSGGTPVLQAMVPANDDRELVPEALRQGTTDVLSALAKVVRMAGATGRCDGQAAVFDGRRRTDYVARTLGTEPLALAGGSVTTQLRCTVESRLLAGRRNDQDPEEARRPLLSEAWLAPIGPGGAVLPVRVDLPTRWFGTVRLVLVRALPAAEPQQVAEQGR